MPCCTNKSLALLYHNTKFLDPSNLTLSDFVEDILDIVIYALMQVVGGTYGPKSIHIDMILFTSGLSLHGFIFSLG